MMLLQRMAVSTRGMPAVLAAFEQEGSTGGGAPDVAAYEFQSGGIVEMMDGLLDKFEKQLSEVEARETSAAQNYDLNKVQLTDMISHSQKNRDEKAATKADLSAKSAKAKGDLARTKESKAADEKTLAEMLSVQIQRIENQKAKTVVAHRRRSRAFTNA